MSSDIESFQTLLAQVKDVFLQENNLLKTGRVAEYSQLMQTKQQLVGKLERELQALNRMRESKTHTDKAQLRSLQDSIMQMLMIDRENEQLLLKKSMGNFQVSGAPRVSTQALQHLTKSL